MPFFAKVTARTPAALRQQQVPPPAAPQPWPLSGAFLGKSRAGTLPASARPGNWGGSGEVFVLVTTFGSRNLQG